MKTFLTVAALLAALSAFAADDQKHADNAGEKPLPERVKEFTAQYDTAEKITKRLAEWTAAEPNSPEPYVIAANAYLKTSAGVRIEAGPPKGEFVITDPKTNKVVGSINEGPSAQGYKLALATLATAAGKFPQRMDIHVGRMSVARDANDIPGLFAAGQELVKAAQNEGDKMRWIDDAPLPGPLPEKVVAELQGRIAWLYQKETDKTDEFAHELSIEALKIAPDSVELLNDAAIYHLYKKEWAAARPYLEHAEKSEPRDLYVKHNLARVLTELGEKKLARAKLQEIIKLSPASEEGKEAKAALKALDKK
jgi:tetratricopeptide (TPR) repeat protein